MDSSLDAFNQFEFVSVSVRGGKNGQIGSTTLQPAEQSSVESEKTLTFRLFFLCARHRARASIVEDIKWLQASVGIVGIFLSSTRYCSLMINKNET